MRRTASMLAAAMWAATVFGIVACDTEPEQILPPEPCELLVCGANALCDDVLEACRCEEGFTGNAETGCVPIASCTEITCQGHGQCDDGTGIIQCTCDEGYEGTYCSLCAEGYVAAPPGSGTCVAEVPCPMEMCNGSGNCVLDGDDVPFCICHPHYTGEFCTECAALYVWSVEEGRCVDGPCVDVDCGAHGTCEVLEGDETTCTCEPGYDAPDDGPCVDERIVLCLDTSPEGAAVVFSQHKVHFDDELGWEDPPECAWECVEDRDEVDGECLHEQLVPCKDVAPEHATSDVHDVTIFYYDDGGWTSPIVCVWTCDEGFDEIDGACLDELAVPCEDVAPEHGEATSDEVIITFSPEEGWTEPAPCPWECVGGYDQIDDQCLNVLEVPCVDVAPANATSLETTHTIYYVEGVGWTEAPSCAWTCDDGFVQEGEECVVE